MNYAALKANVKQLLNRRDVTPALIDSFVQQAIQRAQRLLNAPAMEQTGIYIVDETYDGLPVPGDYLQMVSLKINGREIQRKSLSYVQHKIKYGSGCPEAFARDGFVLKLGPTPQEGDEIEIVYRADFSNLVADTDTNWLTEIIPDIITYAALVEGCTYFTDPRKDSFETSFAMRITDINLMAANDELFNSALTPTHSDESGVYW